MKNKNFIFLSIGSFLLSLALPVQYNFSESLADINYSHAVGLLYFVCGYITMLADILNEKINLKNQISMKKHILLILLLIPIFGISQSLLDSIQGKIEEKIQHLNQTNVPSGITQHDFVLTPPPFPPSGYIIEPSDDDTYTLRPIPCDELFNKNNQETIYSESINVFDYNGNLVFTTKGNNINVSNLKPGVYFIKAIINNEIITKKIIKK